MTDSLEHKQNNRPVGEAGKAAQSKETVQPQKSVQSGKPAQSQKVQQPGKPAQPNKPAQPKKPAQSQKAEQPKKPAQPQKAEQPKKPAQPQKVEQSKKPAQPQKAEQPKKPAQPQKPAQSKKPVQSGKPAKPKKPVIDEDSFEEDFDYEDSFEEDTDYEDSFEESKLPTPPRKGTPGFFMETAQDEEDVKKRSVGKTIFKILFGLIGLAALLYLAAAAFFIGHFYYDTTINGVDFSLKSADDVEKYMSRQVDDYVLTLTELKGETESIAGADIGIRYKQSTQIRKQLKAQNPLLWVRAFWEPDSLTADVGVDYDEDKLSAAISGLECMDESKWTKSKNARPEYDGSEFSITKEVYGTTIRKKTFNKAVRDAISQFVPELNLEENNCYKPPKYVSTSPAVQKACDKMNNYSKASITYQFGDKTEVVDRSIIKDWLKVNVHNMKVTYNEDKVTEYMKGLGEKYDTIGTTRKITSPTGKKVKVSGGTYGWELDEATEAEALKTHIKKGETITKEPAWVQKAASFGDVDWGSTYAEVDIPAQHMWYIKDGKVAFECDVVTGLPTPKRATPTGVHQCLEKAQNKVLRGDRLPGGGYEYQTPVAYWMRVTWSGVGFHTATWQPAFGGNRYTYAGSHGCINMSYSDSVSLYELIQVGDAVIIHD